jgi:hypothetical protein
MNVMGELVLMKAGLIEAIQQKRNDIRQEERELERMLADEADLADAIQTLCPHKGSLTSTATSTRCDSCGKEVYDGNAKSS